MLDPSYLGLHAQKLIESQCRSFCNFFGWLNYNALYVLLPMKALWKLQLLWDSAAGMLVEISARGFYFYCVFSSNGFLTWFTVLFKSLNNQLNINGKATFCMNLFVFIYFNIYYPFFLMGTKTNLQHLSPLLYFILTTTCLLALALNVLF